jgi:hypothetical protein
MPPPERPDTRRALLTRGAVGLGAVGAGLIAAEGSAGADPLPEPWVRRDRMPVNVKDYGALGDGSDQTAAIQTALGAVPAVGGTLFFPAGFYGVSSLDVSGRNSFTLRGEGGANRAAGYGSTLIFTGAGGGTLLDARQTRGLTVEGAQLVYNSPGFNGTFVDLANDTGSGANDTTNAKFRDVGFYGQPVAGAVNAAALVGLENAHTVSFDDCTFMEAQVGVMGRSLATDYSNVISFFQCLFWNNHVAHVKNSGEAWLFAGTTFEPLSGGIPGAYKQELPNTPTGSSDGLTLVSCWMGDSLVGSGGKAWVEWHGAGLNVLGCTIGAANAGNNLIVIADNNCEGIVVKGSVFGGAHPNHAAVHFGPTIGHKSIEIGPNSYYGGATPVAGNIPPGAEIYTADGVRRSTPYTSASRPSAANNEGAVIYVSDAAAGTKFQGSNGSAWVPLG